MVLNCNVIISSAITVLICGAVVYFCHKRLLTIEQSVNKQNQVLAAFIANMQKDIQIGGSGSGSGICARNIPNDLASEEAKAKSKLIVLNRNEQDDDEEKNRNKSNSSTNSSSNSSYAPIEVSSDDEDDDDDSNTDESSEDDEANENKTPTMVNEEIIVGDFEERHVLTDSWVKVIDVDISSIPQSSQLPIERMIVLKQEQEPEDDQEEDDIQRLLHESMFECLTGSNMSMGGGSGAAFVMSSSSSPMPMNISAMFQAHLRERDEQPQSNTVSSIVEIIDTDDSISDVSSASSALAATSVIEVKPNSLKSEYSAMKVDDLRKIIVEQALTSKENAKKLKKQEILDLLSLKK